MKKEWIEDIPAINITHKIVICDNPNCGTVIEDKRNLDCCPTCEKPFDVKLEEHIQIGNKKGDKLLDFCSEKCSKKSRVL